LSHIAHVADIARIRQRVDRYAPGRVAGIIVELRTNMDAKVAPEICSGANRAFIAAGYLYSRAGYSR
jgi:hypothetical protein